jgi:aspartate kinase
MRVFKFGGASIKDAPSVQNIQQIIKQFGQGQPLVVVVSAMGKTTNALEAILQAFWEGDDYEALIQNLQEYHTKIAQGIFWDKKNPIFEELAQYFQTLRQTLVRQTHTVFNELYDQVVSVGELLSSVIVARSLQHEGLKVVWQDAREIIKTDSNWREGTVDWKNTQKQINKILLPLLQDNQIVLTQGFIGGTPDKKTTTLGREGSDYSAAILAHCLKAESQTIWKDVAGVLNGDPKRVPDAQLFAQLSYQEAAEMTYYGASVIHPKTIAPLREKVIPLYVKSFLQPQKSGTCINSVQAHKFVPAIMYKEKQVWIRWTHKDFAFLNEAQIGEILQQAHEAQTFVYAMHREAFALQICTDQRPEKVEKLIQATKAHFTVVIEEEVELLTVKGGESAFTQKLTENRIKLWETQQPNWYQAILRNQ